MALRAHATGIIGAILPALTAILNVMEMLRRALATRTAEKVSGEDIAPYRGSQRLQVAFLTGFARGSSLRLWESQVHPLTPRRWSKLRTRLAEMTGF